MVEGELGHAAAEDDAAGVRAEQVGHRGAGVVDDAVGRALGLGDRAPVGQRADEGARHRVGDGVRHLRATGPVEVREARLQSGEAVADGGDVVVHPTRVSHPLRERGRSSWAPRPPIRGPTPSRCGAPWPRARRSRASASTAQPPSVTATPHVQPDRRRGAGLGGGGHEPARAVRPDRHDVADDVLGGDDDAALRDPAVGPRPAGEGVARPGAVGEHGAVDVFQQLGAGRGARRRLGPRTVQRVRRARAGRRPWRAAPRPPRTRVSTQATRSSKRSVPRARSERARMCLPATAPALEASDRHGLVPSPPLVHRLGAFGFSHL